MSLEKLEPQHHSKVWTEIPYDKLAKKGLLPGSEEKKSLGDDVVLGSHKQEPNSINTGPETPAHQLSTDELSQRRLDRAKRFLDNQKPLNPYQEFLRRQALDSFKKTK